jgi:hypothetical protein
MAAIYPVRLHERRKPMRTIALITSFVALAGLSCAGSTKRQTSTTTVKWPKEALETLTQDELAQLIEALPALSGAMKAAKWRSPNAVGPSHPGREEELEKDQLGTLTRLVESYKLPGINDSLSPYGGWAKIRSTLYKVYAATAALGIDRASPELVAGLKSDTTLRGRKTLKGYEFFKNACMQIPETNKQLVLQHVDDLQLLGSLGN